MSRVAELLLAKMQMLREDATAVARVVQDTFSGADEVEDEVLDAQLRQLFYDLQDAKVLEVTRREYRDDNGRLLRGYKWHILENEVSADAPSPATPAADPLARVYDDLGKDAWAARRRPGSDSPFHA